MSKQCDKMDIEQLVQAALREKSGNETIFKIMAGRNNVSICSVSIPNLRTPLLLLASGLLFSSLIFLHKRFFCENAMQIEGNEACSIRCQQQKVIQSCF